MYKSLLIAGAVLAFAACRKFDTLPYYAKGTAPVLSASTTAITASPADSANAVLTLNWTNPHYATDSATQKYVIEIDSAGHNFMHEYIRTVSGILSTAFTAVELNAIVASFGFRPDSTYSLDIRIKSSYANNNEQYTSNVVTVTITPYIVPITLTPSSTNALVLNIDNASSTAISFNWTASQFGATTIYYALQIDTADSFTTPQVIKYGTSLSGALTVGDLNTALINLGVSAGATANAVFRIVGYLDAGYTQPAVFSNTATVSVKTYLPFLYQYVPGDYQGWNPSTAPSIAATMPNLNAYEGYVYVPSGGSYEFKITSASDWNHTSYGSGGSGVLSTSGGNLVWPNGGQYYLLKTDMSALTWSATITNWGIIGDATPKGWDASTPMTYDATNHVWAINSIALTAGSIKFRANDAWDINLGGNLSALSYGGDNISIRASGIYKVVLDLSHPRRYTAIFTKL